jgi:hypothetical protein
MFSHLVEAKQILEGIKPLEGNLHKIRKIHQLLKFGVQPYIVVLKSEMTKDEAKAEEIRLIALLGHSKNGGVLTNIARGGDGGDTLSNHPRAGNWGSTFDHRGKNNPLYGRFGAQNPKSKTYTFTLPSGGTRVVVGGQELNAMIAELQVSRNGIFDVIKGRKPDHRGISVQVS